MTFGALHLGVLKWTLRQATVQAFTVTPSLPDPGPKATQRLHSISPALFHLSMNKVICSQNNLKYVTVAIKTIHISKCKKEIEKNIHQVMPTNDFGWVDIDGL